MANMVRYSSMSYNRYFSLKEKLHKARVSNHIGNTWLFTSHTPGVFTKGRSYKTESLLWSEEKIHSSGREICEIERGGDITYHGPSQVMIYPFIDVPEHDIENLVRKLERVVVEFLDVFSLKGEPKRGYPGIWCNGSKIASIGLAVRKWTTMHGMSFNHQKDDGGFSMIVPCGIHGVTMTSIEEETGNTIHRDEVVDKLKLVIGSVFRVDLNELDFDRFLELNNINIL